MLPQYVLSGVAKSEFVVLVNKIQFLSNNVCYKVSVRENFHRQSCKITIEKLQDFSIC